MLQELTILAFLPLGGWELAVVIIVGMLVFYGKRMPEIGRNLGKGIVEFKKGLSGSDDEQQEKPKPEEPKATSETDKTPEKTS